MERAVALKKLRKILGGKFGYRFDPRAPDTDERNAAREEAKALSEHCKAAEAARDARRDALLAADDEYQRLKETAQALRDAKETAWSVAHHYRVTVGTSSGMFFHVRAQGSSWEDVIKQLETKR